MTDRFSAWVGAGVLALGVSVATVAGAATAVADDGADASSTTSSESTASPVRERSGTDGPEASAEPPEDATDPSGTEDETEPPVDEEIADEPTVDEDEPADDPEEVEESVDEVEANEESGPRQDGADEVSAPTKVDAVTSPGVADPAAVVSDGTIVADDAAESSPAPVPAEQGGPRSAANVPETVTTSVREPSPAAVRLPMTATDEDRAPLPSLLNVVGSFLWGLFDLVTKLVDVPPAVPPGSTLTAGRSKLEIDCGDGYTADADWYFPTEGEPEKFIYFQHGFLARAGFYNVSLQQLAERNNAIVVAPSITTNIFACDACASSGEPMHMAVARLFEGDRAALLASARAAGYDGTLPEEFVLAGQSAGASLAIAAAGFYYESASDAEKADMAGVLLYEVSAIGGAKTGNALSNGLDKLPDSVPVLTIAAEPNMLNSKNNANAVFVEERPGQFNGVQLVGGAHSDAFRSDILFGIPQLIVNVFFGASTPVNTEAVHVLTTGWLTDMFAGRVYDPATRTGIYGVPGEPGQVVIEIPTTEGVAGARVLPVQVPTPNPFDQVINFFFGLMNANHFARCADFPDETATAASAAGPQSCPL
ncbi:hypothetical protein [Mycolicibacterium austroafricanum]|uniref:hypothetical protein n=1 Tax=Mycolicibacterium austroafricanum TaxID=39687 RepID=UPI001CA33917|nr:hypothetical protein [Mycolicibacterium austroafricanum]QZT62664.1 hypothetical protein JN085_28085 [Mycolicibacterium austroafricanum]